MTLNTRLLLFYLGSLTLLLAGFSTTIYLVASDYLHRQAHERVEAALNTLLAAMEIKPGGVEWEPHERDLRIAPGPGGEPIVWLITDRSGLQVARSEPLQTDEKLSELANQLTNANNPMRQLKWKGKTWFAGQVKVNAGHDIVETDPNIKMRQHQYHALLITAAIPLDATRALLNKLLALLGFVAFGVLAVALIAGRFVCRRALLPVQRMAADARAVDPADPHRRIGIPSGGDELTDLGNAFNGLLDRLHESLERQRRFAGDASHQLRTPLAAMLGQIEVTLRRERGNEEYVQALRTTQKIGGHLQRIIEALLFLQRADADAMVLQQERIDLTQWLPAHLATWADHPRRADMVLAGIEGSVPVISHPVLLGEILNILLDNACHYSISGSRITITISRLGDEACIEVRDQGQGIADADLPRIFSPFFRTTPALRANRGGVGLGLSIAQRLCTALGGRLRVSSRLGEGSCFEVGLPILGDCQGNN